MSERNTSGKKSESKKRGRKMRRTQRTSSQQPKRLNKTLTRAIILTICTLWLTSCTTTRTSENNPAPKYYPPDPYDETGALVWEEIKGGETFTASEDGIFLPWWYWQQTYNYIVNTQSAQEIASGEK